MKLRGLFWKSGRFSWLFITAVIAGTALLLWFDWFWRTHDTSLSRFF
ncbi:MAG: hypothetical protein KDC87_01535 [Planctomycetes bacterium]|nr:hypothetical protein [Planctomycetota bacterium]MCB9869912.1 hypothetical protein [Planctomycetota bacterium]